MRRFRRLFEFFRSLAGVLSDQTAYERYLTRKGITHSAEEWRRWADDRFRRKYRQGKCC